MMPREGTLIADRYRLERKVGGGRVCAVWRVHDEISARACALKLLHRSMHKHPEALTRFSLEDRLARELSGPHFAERVGSGVWDGMRYIAWRWHEGESLRALYERNPKQDAPTVHSIVQEVCKALSLVHSAGYVHGDVKPENVLFTDGGGATGGRQIKLLGFGVASRLSRPSAGGFGLGRRRPGEIVGTPLYLSPDVILGRVPKAGQADLWALAVMVYEALTGQAPFWGADLGAVLEAILDKRAPRPTSIAESLPGSFDAWWSQALEQEFETPSELASSLARALAPALRTSHTQRSAALPERPPPVAAPASAPPPPEAASVLPPEDDPSVPAELAAAPSAPGPSAPGPSASGPSASGIAAPASPRPAPRPAASPAAGVAAAPPAMPRGRTSVTAAGLGPVEPLPPRPSAAASEPAAGEAGRPFAPLPSPLRDFAGDVSRKTLVGITPLAGHPPPAPARRPSAPAKTIAGAPCRPIDTGAHVEADAVARPTHPTVPFPRPRVASRAAAAATDDSDIERNWNGTSTRTLRFVLTSPDHKPQRIAAALVCAAAALVIFAIGRSPVSGTARIGLGQSTEALSTERGPAPRKPAEVLADPATDLAAASGSDAEGELPVKGPEATKTDEADERDERQPSPPGELAPGLIAPGAAGAVQAGRGSAPAADAAAPGPAEPEAAPPHVPPPPRRATTPAPLPPPPPPPKAPGDLDFGI